MQFNDVERASVQGRGTRIARVLCSEAGRLFYPAALAFAFSLISGRHGALAADENSVSTIRLHAAEPITVAPPALLYAIDDHAIPLTRGLTLEMSRPEKHVQNPIVRRGRAGSLDDHRAEGSAVLYHDGKWRMWYLAWPASGMPRVAYAASDDGLRWSKPRLDLVEWNGSKHNNLLAAEPGLATIAILHDADAPQERRYVMVGEDARRWQGSGAWDLRSRRSATRIDVSPDGLRWRTISTDATIGQQNETLTIYRFKGQYHLGGHQISPLLRLPLQHYDLGGYLGPRAMVVWRSPRLDRWPPENCKAFFKPQQSSSPHVKQWDREEVHLGATVTSMNNVCLGIYGQWHHPTNPGAPEYHAKSVSADLGLLVSNDGLHFREPAPGYHFLERDQERAWETTDGKLSPDNLMLLQGSLVNTPTRTHVYYSASTAGGNTELVHGNIGLATLPRDRFGCLRLCPGTPDGQLLTCPIELNFPCSLYVNAEIPSGSEIRLSLTEQHGLDELAGFSGDKAAVLRRSGLDLPVKWQTVLPRARRFCIRADLRGQAKLFALTLR